MKRRGRYSHPWDNSGYRAVSRSVNEQVGRSLTTRDAAGGTQRSIQMSDAILINTFANAMKGDMRMARRILKLADDHLRDKDKVPDDKVIVSEIHEVTQRHIDLWAAVGALPAGCPQDISKLTAGAMNKAHRNYKTMISEIESRPGGEEKLRELGRKMFGDAAAFVVDDLSMLTSSAQSIRKLVELTGEPANDAGS